MSEKERYATLATWERILREEGVDVSRPTLYTRIKEAGIIGETARCRTGEVLKNAYYAESEIRWICADFINRPTAIDFFDPVGVREDLLAFAVQLGADKTPLDLHMGNIHCLPITCRNGVVMQGSSYLFHAKLALGLASTKAEARSQKASTLRFLLRMAGFDIFDRTYFENPQNVRADLIAFATQLGEGATPLDLSTAKIIPYSIVCSNGQSMRGETYLCNAGASLGFAEGTREAARKQASILRHLIKTAGYEPFDGDYFRNPQILQEDFQSFSQVLGDDKTPLDLNSSNISALVIACHNGQTMKGQTWLRNAAKALGLATNDREAGTKLPVTLRKLQRIAGYLTPSDDR